MLICDGRLLTQVVGVRLELRLSPRHPHLDFVLVVQAIFPLEKALVVVAEVTDQFFFEMEFVFGSESVRYLLPRLGSHRRTMSCLLFHRARFNLV